jgi:DNA-binding transcriptional ArsR family regulator
MSQSGVTSELNDAAGVLKAAGEPTRLRVLKVLEDGELCACHLVALVGLAQPTVSRHLSVLRAAGLIADRKEGRWTHYRLASASSFPRRLLDLLAGWEGDPVVAADRKKAREYRKVPVAEFCADGKGTCS